MTISLDGLLDYDERDKEESTFEVLPLQVLLSYTLAALYYASAGDSNLIWHFAALTFWGSLSRNVTIQIWVTAFRGI